MGAFIYYELIFIIYIAFLMVLSFLVSIQALENGDVHCECIRNHRNPCNNCVSYGHMYMSVLLSLWTSLCFSMRKQVLKTLTVITTETIFLLAISELINCT